MSAAVRRMFGFFVLICLVIPSAESEQGSSAAQPGARSVMDAHNCYPYSEWWTIELIARLRQALQWQLSKILHGTPIPKRAEAGQSLPTANQ